MTISVFVGVTVANTNSFGIWSIYKLNFGQSKTACTIHDVLCAVLCISCCQSIARMHQIPRWFRNRICWLISSENRSHFSVHNSSQEDVIPSTGKRTKIGLVFVLLTLVVAVYAIVFNILWSCIIHAIVTLFIRRNLGIF